MRYFWRIMEEPHVVIVARILAGYAVIVAWLATLGSQL